MTAMHAPHRFALLVIATLSSPEQRSSASSPGRAPQPAPARASRGSSGRPAPHRGFRGLAADRGRTWSVVETPVASTTAGGIFSLAFTDPRHGIAVGGDFLDPANAPDGAAYTVDGGVTWRPADGPGEYRSGSHRIPRLPWTAVAVGPTGSDVTTDGGRTWTRFDSRSFDSVECAPTGGCWASGAQGAAARLVVDR
jgi:hypothetical protein